MTRNLVLDERSSRVHMLLHVLFIDDTIGAGTHESVKVKKTGIRTQKSTPPWSRSRKAV